MKFHHFQAFEKHLEATADEQLSRLYAVVCTSLTERDILVRVLYKRLKAKFEGLQLESVDFSKGLSHVLSAAENSLFCRSKLICVKNVEKLSEKDLQTLAPLLMGSDPVVFMGSSSSALKELCQKYKQDLVAVDLTVEKPWEKEDRFQKWSLSYLKRFNLGMSPLDLKALVQNHSNFDEIKQELDKLSIYAKDQKMISHEAVKELCHFSFQSALWKVSEDLVFFREVTKLSALFKSSIETSDMQALFGNFRFHLELALLLKSGSNDKLPKGYQNIHSKTLEKYKRQVRQTSLASLKNAFQALLKYERFSRSVTTDPKTLITCLAADITRQNVA